MNLALTQNLGDLFRAVGYEVLSKEEPSCEWRIVSCPVEGTISHPKITQTAYCSQRGTFKSFSLAIARCELIMKHGAGYTSEVGMEEAIRRGIDPKDLEDRFNGPAAICVTVLKDYIPVCHIYVAVRSCDTPAENIKCAQLVVPHIDEYIHSLGTGWLIGGALPEDYERLGEADEP